MVGFSQGYAVNKQQHLGVGGGKDPPDGKNRIGPAGGVERYVQPGDSFEHLTEAGGSHVFYIFGSNHGANGGCAVQRFRAASGGADQAVGAIVIFLGIGRLEHLFYRLQLFLVPGSFDHRLFCSGCRHNIGHSE